MDKRRMEVKIESGAVLLGRMNIQTKLLLASNLVILAIIYLMQYSASVFIWIAWVEFAMAVFSLGVIGIIREFKFTMVFMTLFYTVVLAVTFIYIVVSTEIRPDEMNAVTYISIALVAVTLVSMFFESRTYGEKKTEKKN